MSILSTSTNRFNDSFMNRRNLTIIFGALAGAFLLLVMAALYTLQTSWLKAKVREKIVSEAERASGGRVEIGSFQYDWRTLTAHFSNFVVHGTEPSGAPPLFQADSVRVGLKIVSFLKRDIDIASLVVEHPNVHLLVHRDGATNIPTPPMRRTASETVQDLLDLKIRHFEFNHGAIDMDLTSLPVDLQGEDLMVLVSYDRTGPRYDARISSNKISFNSDRFRPFSGTLNATAQLERGRLLIQQIMLQSKASKLQVAGTVQHFVHPIVDLNLEAQLEAPDISSVARIPGLLGGHLKLTGVAHYDVSAFWAFQGKISGRSLVYRSNSLSFQNVGFTSNLLAQREQVKFTHLTIAAPGGNLNGEASLKHFRDFELDGRLSGFNIREAGSFFPDRPIPWSGVASGSLHLEGRPGDRNPDFAVQSNLRIVPAAGAIPVSGNIDVSYAKRSGAIQFGDSHLNFPSTQLSFSGGLGANLGVTLDSSNLNDVSPALRFLRLRTPALPVLLRNGSAHFDGTIAGAATDPQIQGNLALTRFRARGQTWDQLRSHVELSPSAADFSSLTLDQGSLHISGDGHVGLRNWNVTNDSPLRIEARFRGANIVQAASEYTAFKLPVAGGIAFGSVDLRGSVAEPQGAAQINIDNADAYGERLNEIQLSAQAAQDQVRITRGRMQAGPAVVSFSGAYRHVHGSWRSGQAELKIESNGFPLAALAPVRKYEPGLNAQFEIHAEAAARITPGHVEPTTANGTVAFRDVTVDNVPYGSVTMRAATHGTSLNAAFEGDLRESRLTGSAEVLLAPGNPVKGEFRLGRIRFETLYALFHAGRKNALPFDGFLEGGLTFEGPLQNPSQLRARAQLQEIQFSSAPPAGQKAPDLVFRNVEPIVLDASNGIATVRNFHIGGKDTSLTLAGSIPYAQQGPMDLRVEGAVDLRIFELFDPHVQSSGQSLVRASVAGTLAEPSVNGTLELRHGSFFLKNVANGLTDVNGTVKFDRDRATIQKLTAQSGGGELSLGGFATLSPGGPLVYRLEANAENVRVRYAGGISVTSTSALRLTGTSDNSVLSGTVTVSRVVLNPNTDVGNVLASLAAPAASPSNEKDFLTGLQLDVRVESAPDLQLSTALSRDVEAEVDLRLRGTLDHPVLLGNVAANQGEIKIFGTKYSVNRGEVSFFNSVKIEPVLDLDLQTEARGITVDVTVSGTFNKLNINYRSDPPLQPRDIIALLTVGRAPNTVSNMPNAQVTNDVSALQSGANTVLGQAISPTSSRLSKLFGITNIKIDPLAQGITNTPQARLSIEQQISRQITVTYVTNLSQTSEQIFRLEWAFSRQYSLVALRDDNGEFGIDIQYKKRFK